MPLNEFSMTRDERAIFNAEYAEREKSKSSNMPAKQIEKELLNDNVERISSSVGKLVIFGVISLIFALVGLILSFHWITLVAFVITSLLYLWVWQFISSAVWIVSHYGKSTAKIAGHDAEFKKLKEQIKQLEVKLEQLKESDKQA